MEEWHRKFKNDPKNYPGPLLQIIEITRYDDEGEDEE
jgi:hypothetical protein